MCHALDGDESGLQHLERFARWLGAAGSRGGVRVLDVSVQLRLLPRSDPWPGRGAQAARALAGAAAACRGLRELRLDLAGWQGLPCVCLVANVADLAPSLEVLHCAAHRATLRLDFPLAALAGLKSLALTPRELRLRGTAKGLPPTLTALALAGFAEGRSKLLAQVRPAVAYDQWSSACHHCSSGVCSATSAHAWPPLHADSAALPAAPCEAHAARLSRRAHRCAPRASWQLARA